MFDKVNTRQNFPQQEDEINEFWKEKAIFRKSIEQRDPENKYVFYDGPPFITGTPHYGSLLPSIAKDVVPRYWAMKGKYVERKWGWDCHGLPIENKVEKKLELANRRAIEDYGIQEFIDQCYSYTRSTSAEWRWYIEKIGRWVDMDNSYKTMDQDYMESVIWVFKELYQKDLIYEGMRTSLYCTRCGTPVSNFEIAMDNSYADMEDPAVTIKFPVISEGDFKGANILAWTTTPWTLPSNKALVVDPEETYIRVKVQKLEVELEQAWLVKELPADLKEKAKMVQITQAYLPEYTDENGNKARDARVRKIGDKFEFTVKNYAGSSKETGQLIEKTEAIDKERYVELIKQTDRKVVKRRYYYPLDNDRTAEIDIYENDLTGLEVVEVEFPSLSALEGFKAPEWFGKEVSDSDDIWPYAIALKKYDEIKPGLDAYQQAEHNYEEQIQTDEIIFAKKRSEYVLGDMDHEVISEFKGEKLLGLEYEPPFSYFESGEKDHRVYSYEGMVHMEEGTGIVHSAPGFGDIDTEMGNEHGLDIAMSIDDAGKYLDKVSDYAGIYVKDADPQIINDLRSKDKLFKVEQITHRYPYCYRCETPLIHKAQPSWYINIEKLRDKMLANNEKVNWVPEHLKQGRFKKGIEVAPDWGISRTRYWATPMPVWQLIENGEVKERVVIGSRDELREKAMQPITKLSLLRHCDSVPASGDVELTELGKQKASALSQDEKLTQADLIISSSAQRTKASVAELAQTTGKELVVNEAFGSVEKSAALNESLTKLYEQHNVSKVSDLSNEVLEKEFSSLIEEVRAELEKLLKENVGKHLIISTHNGWINIVKHIVEGTSLNEALAQTHEFGSVSEVFFNGTDLLDLHRPKIDAITLKGEHGELKRVEEVLDVWMDSASMPYAQKHYPFENRQDFEDNFPADFVVEYIAQTRAWFYVMHVIASALFDTNSFNNVITTGVIFGTDGRKMSKSYGNYPDPKETLQTYGGEALRLYLMGSRIMVGEDVRIDEDEIKEQLKVFMLPLWNSYSFFVTYANMHDWKPSEKLASNIRKDNPETEEVEWDHIPFQEIGNDLDRWIITRLQQAIRDVRIAMDDYNIPAAVRELPEFVSDLSKWYIRRSRDRFADGDEQALATLYYVLVEFTKLIAPIAPFISEAIYQNLVAGQLEQQPESVHLTDYPNDDLKFLEKNSLLLEQMQKVRQIVNMGQSIRVQNSLKVRQPLAEVEVIVEVDPAKETDLTDWMKELIADELNVKKVQEKNEFIKKTGWIEAKDESSELKVYLDANLTAELKREGMIRELTRQVQYLRKKANLQLEDKIQLSLSTSDQELLTAVDLHQAELKEATSAAEIQLNKQQAANATKQDINGAEVVIAISKL